MRLAQKMPTTLMSWCQSPICKDMSLPEQKKKEDQNEVVNYIFPRKTLETVKTFQTILIV